MKRERNWEDTGGRIREREGRKKIIIGRTNWMKNGEEERWNYKKEIKQERKKKLKRNRRQKEEKK